MTLIIRLNTTIAENYLLFITRSPRLSKNTFLDKKECYEYQLHMNSDGKYYFPTFNTFLYSVRQIEVIEDTLM